MNWFAQVVAGLEAFILISVGFLEAFRYRDQRLYPIFRIKPEEADAVRLWTVNVGFYNMVCGLGLLLGVILASVGDGQDGRTLVLFISAVHVILGIVLGISEPKLIRSAIGQSAVPLLVIILTLTLPY